MIKRAIKLTSFLCGVMVSLLVFQYITVSQQRTPLGTTKQLDLDFSESNISKEKTISDLNKMVDDNEVIFLKTSVDSERYKDKKDIIWFGSEKPESKKLIIDNNHIHWLDSSLEGEMISSLDVGVRPLSGTYSYSINDDQIFFDELEQWAVENNINILWLENQNPNVLKIIYSQLFLNGVGNGVIASFLLLLTTIITWLVSHAKSRAIRLLGGVKTNKIHTEDILTIISCVLVGFLLSLFVSLGYVGVTKGIQQIKLIIWPTLGILLAVIFLITCCTAIFSIVASPKADHIAKREIPLKRFDILGKLNRVVIVVMALIVIPMTVKSALVTNKLSNEHALWENMQTFVRLSFSNYDVTVQRLT